MVKYKEKWLKTKKELSKITAHSLDLSESKRKHMNEYNIPYRFAKDKGFKMVETEEAYLLYV